MRLRSRRGLRPDGRNLPGLLVLLGAAGALPGTALGQPPAAAAVGVNQASPPRSTGLEARLVGVVAQHLAGRGFLAPLREGRLDEVARQSCLDLADRPVEVAGEATAAGGPGPRPEQLLEPARLQHLLWQEGVADAEVQPLALCGQEEALPAALRRLLAQPVPGGDPRPTHLGVAAVRLAEGDGSACATVLLLHRFVRLEPWPRQVEVGGSLRLVGERLAEASRVRLLLCGPSGRVQELALVASGRRFLGVVPFVEGMGAYHLQLLAETRQGPVVAATFPIHAGIAPPRHPVVRLFPDPPPGSGAADEHATERQALTLLNRDRLRQGLAPLQLHPLLGQAARRHSEQMRDRRFFGHVSPEQLHPGDRLRRLGLGCERQAENLSIAPDAARAHALLMASPAHRRNILDPELTHVGLGAAWDHGPVRSLFLTQLFARLPEQAVRR
ncbi:MAG: hypothetical protein FJ125_01395 [Deltaproteobacteria bacterium]|nr:hypothetical protein [Deltaproteobacteria bacterium]